VDAEDGFSHFDGSDARIWIDKCTDYFTMYQIPPMFRVPAMSIHMSGPAAQRFQMYKQNHGFQQWDQFVEVVVFEFEVDTHRAKTMELLVLNQTGSVEDYDRSFEKLVYAIRLYDNSLSNTMLTSQFILGLKDELRSQVEM
jgi:hypothetical protein